MPGSVMEQALGLALHTQQCCLLANTLLSVHNHPVCCAASSVATWTARHPVAPATLAHAPTAFVCGEPSSAGCYHCCCTLRLCLYSHPIHKWIMAHRHVAKGLL